MTSVRCMRDLQAFFADFLDPRPHRGRRHWLPAMLTSSPAQAFCGADSYMASTSAARPRASSRQPAFPIAIGAAATGPRKGAPSPHWSPAASRERTGAAPEKPRDIRYPGDYGTCLLAATRNGLPSMTRVVRRTRWFPPGIGAHPAGEDDEKNQTRRSGCLSRSSPAHRQDEHQDFLRHSQTHPRSLRRPGCALSSCHTGG